MIIHKYKNKSISCLLKRMSRKDTVRFGINCSEDCFDFIDDKYKKTARELLNLCEKYIVTPKEELFYNNKLRIEIKNIIDLIDRFEEVPYKLYNSEYWIKRESLSTVRYTGNRAVFAFQTRNKSIGYGPVPYIAARVFSTVKDNKTYVLLNSLYNYEIKKYGNYAKTYFSTTDFQHTEESKSFLKEKVDKASISALTDYLLDNNENIILFDGDNVKLNLPYKEKTEYKSLDQLIDDIAKNKHLVSYLKRLYCLET